MKEHHASFNTSINSTSKERTSQGKKRLELLFFNFFMLLHVVSSLRPNFPRN